MAVDRQVDCGVTARCDTDDLCLGSIENRQLEWSSSATATIADYRDRLTTGATNLRNSLSTLAEVVSKQRQGI